MVDVLGIESNCSFSCNSLCSSAHPATGDCVSACYDECIAGYIKDYINGDIVIDLNDAPPGLHDLDKLAMKYKGLSPSERAILFRKLTKDRQRSREAYRPYSPFSADRLSSHRSLIMWVIILILTVGFIVVMSQKK